MVCKITFIFLINGKLARVRAYTMAEARASLGMV